jgi:anti-sigma factor RsiW
MKREVPEADLHAFVDDQLDPARRRQVVAYLEAHPEEMHRVRQYSAQKAAVATALSAAAGQVGRSETEILAQRLARRLAESATWPRYRTRLAVAGAAFLFAALGWSANSLIDWLQERTIPEVVESAALAHQIFAEDRVRPVELPASAAREMAAWFSAHLGERIQIPNLTDVGLRFVGGRLLSSDDGPLVQLLYEDVKARRLSLYLSLHESDEDDPLRVVRIDDVSAGYWQEDHILYAIVAKTGTEQIQLIAAEIGAPAARGRL